MQLLRFQISKNQILTTFCITFIFAALAYLLYQNTYVRDIPTDFTRITEVKTMFEKLQKGEEVEKSPDLNFTHIYIVPDSVYQKVYQANQQSTDLPKYQNQVKVFVDQVKQKYPSAYQLEGEYKQNAYFEDLKTRREGSDEDIDKFFRYNIENSFEPHTIIRIPTKVSSTDLPSPETSDIRVIGQINYDTDKNWSDIDRLQIFKIDDEKTGVLLTLPQSYGYERAAMFAMYREEDYALKSPLYAIFDLSQTKEEDLDIELINLQSEIISEGEGLLF